MNPQYAAVIVVSEDDGPVTDRFGRWLQNRETYVAEGVRDVSSALCASLGVVLVAPAAARTFGERVIEKVRNRELPCQVAAMLDSTSDEVVPGFDAYVPVEISRSEFDAVMRRLDVRTQFCHELAEHFDLVNVKVTRPHLVEERILEAELRASRSTLSAFNEEFDSRDYRALFRSIGDDWSLS